jgi:hypothetical protein
LSGLRFRIGILLAVLLRSCFIWLLVVEGGLLLEGC